MSDNQIEAEIQAKGLTAPRITPADIEANIASEHYFTAQHGVDGAMAALGLHQRHADTDTLAQAATHPAYETLSRMTICVLILRNGFTVEGINNGPVSAANFDAALGRKMARQKAIGQIWPLMGYELRSKLAQG